MHNPNSSFIYWWGVFVFSTVIVYGAKKTKIGLDHQYNIRVSSNVKYALTQFYI